MLLVLLDQWILEWCHKVPCSELASVAGQLSQLPRLADAAEVRVCIVDPCIVYRPEFSIEPN
jgi:hypothetical protein